MFKTMKIVQLGVSLLHKSADGQLTLEEIAESLADFSPHYFQDVLDAVQDAEQDGHISVDEIIDIAMAVVK